MGLGDTNPYKSEVSFSKDAIGSNQYQLVYPPVFQRVLHITYIALAIVPSWGLPIACCCWSTRQWTIGPVKRL